MIALAGTIISSTLIFVIFRLFEKYKIDIVQLPINIIDRRFVKSAWLRRLKKNNVEIHARSVFLQGLLLSKSLKTIKYFKKWQKLCVWFC